MSEQELQDMKQKVDYLDSMHKFAFLVIGAIVGIYLVKNFSK